MGVDTTGRIEPCRLDRFSPELADQLAQVPAEARVLGSRLHSRTAESLADLVRVMNCYYSNLIEGHDTRPRDIERALRADLDGQPDRRNLQLEAAAHIRVQREIDRQAAAGVLADPASVDFIVWLHREFYAGAPESMLTIGAGDRAFRMEPGRFRSSPQHDVAVGRHQPPASDRVDELMSYFAGRFRSEGQGPAEQLVSLAAAHHRLNYIHPFPDGNGRVSRLMSHAMAHRAGIGAHGLWSVSRGLARGLASRTEYKAMMDLADSPREGDLDGRVNLSARCLERFATWFLGTCLDQLRFMNELFGFDRLVERLGVLVTRESWAPRSLALLEEVLLRGELARGEAQRITGLPERSARELLARLVQNGILASATPKGPVSLRVTIASAEALFPKLFPET